VTTIVVIVIANYNQSSYLIILMVMVILRLTPITKVEFINEFSDQVHNNSFNFKSYQVNFLNTVNTMDFNYSYLLLYLHLSLSNFPFFLSNFIPLLHLVILNFFHLSILVLLTLR